MSSSKSNDQISEEWTDLVNMTKSELKEWLDTEESKSVGDSDSGESTGHKSGRRIVETKDIRKDDLTEGSVGRVIFAPSPLAETTFRHHI
jgi:hypothetical protein